MTIGFSVPIKSEQLKEKYGDDKDKLTSFSVRQSSWEEFTDKLEKMMPTNLPDGKAKLYAIILDDLRKPLNESQGSFCASLIKIFLENIKYNEKDHQLWIYKQFYELAEVATDCNSRINWC